MMKKIGMACGGILLLAACSQNPFPETGSITDQPLEEPKFELTLPSVVECVAGLSCTFEVQARVRSDVGYPVLTATNLPEGAAFYETGGQFEWTPALTDHAYTATIYVLLSGSNDPMNYGLVRTVLLHVAPGSAPDPTPSTGPAINPGRNR
jgi:hypothetical protein